MEISSIAAAQPGASTNTAAEAKLSENFDDFLKLLTTQLRYQDPLSPLDSNEFVGQLVQFSQVEQSINTNKNLEKLLSLQQGNLISVGLGYIGRTVEANGEIAPLVDSKAEFSYTLNENAAASTIAIADADGKIVFSSTGETGAGRHKFVWDGLDNNGDALPEGVYRFVVAALDKNAEQIGTTTTTTAKVTGIENSENGLLLLFGDVKVSFEKIISVRETPPPAS
jgi:flagellar basal-body rod modification protein FlgD